MNASQRLWRRLAAILPADHFAWLAEEHKRDLARDRRATKYRTYLRYERQALATIALCNLEPLMDGPKIKNREEERLKRVRAWLEAHQDWKS